MAKQLLPIHVAGNLGNIAGPASDGVLLGQLTATAVAKAILKGQAFAALCITDDGGTYVDDTTDFGESTANDVAPLPAVPAVDDACYFGHATKTFQRLDVNGTTQGAGTWTVVWEYWNGSSWASLGATDGTSGFTAATGWQSVTWTKPTDWATCLVDGSLGYWIRARVSAYTSVTTQPLLGQGYAIDDDNAVWTDDTTDFNDAGAGDVDLLPAYPVVGDGIYLGLSEKFCKVKVTTSQARTGTATLSVKYWNGTSWTAIAAADLDDDSTGWSATAGTHIIHFVPPSDWAANTAANGPNGEAGYFVVVEMTAMTDVTQQPLATQGWVYPLETGASGLSSPVRGTIDLVSMMAQTASATNNDSVFLVLNITQGTFAEITWTKADAYVEATADLDVLIGDELALIQVKEDGTTEFANAQFNLRVGA